MIQTISIKPGFAKPFWSGNPLVFPRAIQDCPENLKPCEWVQVFDHNQQLIGYGVYNEASLYRVRILSWANEGFEGAQTLESVLQYRLNKAQALRQVFNLPSKNTDAFRLINSEGDQLSGITIDHYANSLVISITARWGMVYQSALKNAITAVFPKHQLIWRTVEKSLKQDGWVEPANQSENAEPIHIVENDIRYVIDPYKGQKTGFYCDHRETRLLVRSLAEGRKVLDLFCFNGGFALNAAKGGALKVIGVDSSAAALAQANENKQLNDFPNIEFIEQDAIKPIEGHRDFDLIILDPPKLASSKTHAKKAQQYYQELNMNALQKLPKDGLLLTCSCSQAISLQDFERIILDAARAVKKQVQILKIGGAGPDHPVDLAFLEGTYLKWLLLRII
jgi:23S rRNA (cytosine1962-C5)-methyltransferase